jgi:S-(hydroxymethyl)glutathione dehydrogenase/alcohol dehydrogenase
VSSFQAAVLVKLNSPLEIMSLKFPKLNHDQILVRNIYSGICRSQVMEIQGKRGEDNWLPHLLGHEGYGIVEEVGNSVTKVKKGDKVILSWVKGNGTQSPNPIFTSVDGLKINAGKACTFSEFTVTSECFLAKAPDSFSEKLLPLFGCAFLTGAGMVLRNLRPLDKRIVIIGFGGVGSSAAIALDGYEGLDVLIVEESEQKRLLAKNLGFTNIKSPEEVLSLTNYFDLCIESGGTINSIHLGFELINNNGKMVFASHPEAGKKISLDPFDLIKGKQIEGSWAGGSHLDRDVELISRLLWRSKKNLELLVGTNFQLDEINSAIDYLLHGSPGRPLLYLDK